MKDIKHKFFTYRNGAMADSLRRYGMPHKVIFGLNVPQIADIARGIDASEDLADKLWADSEVRESRLLACYLFSPEQTSFKKALRLAMEVRTQEEADMLTFRLLKRLPFSKELLTELKTSHLDSSRMTIQALTTHLL